MTGTTSMTTEKRQHVAVVDDHQDIRELLARYLTENGYRVTVAPHAAAFRAALAIEVPDLIVLDVMMPGEDGLSLCRELSARRIAPVIFLTALATDIDRIVGLEVGADDYLVKPFNPRELLARIKAVLRRSGPADSARTRTDGSGQVDARGAIATIATIATSEARVRFDDKTLDVGRREVTGPDGVAIPLSSVEFDLLRVFLRNPGVVLSRDRLLQETAGRRSDAWDRTIDNRISRLRRKIEADHKNPTLIRTQWGDGYLFTGKVVSP